MQNPSHSKFIEHTLLRATATQAEIEQLCKEAVKHSFYGVCVNTSHVELAYSRLHETDIKVVATVGFPLGAMASDVKRYETEAAVDFGAHEIDVVLNVGWVKEAKFGPLLRELRDLVDAAQELTVKVIIETCFLTDQEKVRCCELVVESGAQFVKTSTGFGSGGATVDDVRLMRRVVGDEFGVKASGGIRDAAQFMKLIDAGANRIGTSSGIAILEEIERLEPE